MPAVLKNCRPHGNHDNRGPVLSLLGASLAVFLCSFSTSASAQVALLESDWITLETEYFTFVSQDSARRTRSAAIEIEQWRRVAGELIIGSALPADPIPNYVYLFASEEDLAAFTYVEDSSFFSATPRANFIALLSGDDSSMALALHHYAHFLIRNYADLRLPRWYEEGLAAYVARVGSGRNAYQFDQYSARNNNVMVQINDAFSMERLLFRDQALASPRNLQIANLKAESLYYYLTHGYAVDGFADRRASLGNYLGYLLEGRNPRFAYDRSFDVTTEQLDAELKAFLQQSERPRVEMEPGLPEITVTSAETIPGNRLTVLLGELALNGGRPETAQLFFTEGLAADQSLARSHSGLGDALRFQESGISDQEVAAHFQAALESAPAEVNIVLDYGEYWEAELMDCEKQYPPAERQYLLGEIETSFGKAKELDPDSPEVYLALGQLALMPERDWQSGLEFQQRAFELLPGDSFIMEQAARYAIEARDYERASLLIEKLAIPIHSFGEPSYVTDLRERLLRKRRNEVYERCADK